MKNIKTLILLLLSVVSLTWSTTLSGQQRIRKDTIQGLTLEDFNSSEYGDGTSIGFGIFDGISFIARKRINKSQDQVGLGVSLFSNVLADFDDVENPEFTTIRGINFRPEYNFYIGDTYKEKVKRNKVKTKYRKHFLSVKGGLGLTSEGNVYSAGLAWHRQTYKAENKKYAKGFDLGIMYNFGDIYRTNTSGSLYLRLDWGWFRA